MADKTYKCIGWVRNSFGRGDVKKYVIKDICNCITTFCGGSGWKDSTTGMALTTPHILIKHGDKIKF